MIFDGDTNMNIKYKNCFFIIINVILDKKVKKKYDLRGQKVVDP